MEAIVVYTFFTIFIMILNALGLYLLDCEPMRVETILILSFAITWCVFEDKKGIYNVNKKS